MRCRLSLGLSLLATMAYFAIAAPAAAVAGEGRLKTFVRFVQWPIAPLGDVIVVCQPHDVPPLPLQSVEVRRRTLLVH